MALSRCNSSAVGLGFEAWGDFSDLPSNALRLDMVELVLFERTDMVSVFAAGFSLEYILY